MRTDWAVSDFSLSFAAMSHSPSQPLGAYPRIRMRRNRRADWSRRLVAENVLTPADFIWPVFVHGEKTARSPIPSMPGVNRLSLEALVEDAGKAKELGIPVIALFPATP